MGMTVYIGEIYVDTREKPRAIRKILEHFERVYMKPVHRKLDVGDYMLPDGKTSVDRKQNLLEVTANLCQQRGRFAAECIRAKNSGVQLVILVEHGGRIKTMEDVQSWHNPRLEVSPYAVSGPRLYQLMKEFESRYGIQWAFCGKQQTGKAILQILAGG